MIWYNTNSSKCTDFCWFHVSNLLLRNIKEVEYPIVAHHSQPIVFLIECHCLEPLIYLNFSETQVAVKIPTHNFHEAEPRLLIFSFCVSISICWTESVLLQLYAFFDRGFYFKQMNRWFIRGTRYDVEWGMEHYSGYCCITRASSQGL